MTATNGPKGPFCQSCGMPLEKPEDFGTAADRLRINDYCHFCFERGVFTQPEISERAMIEKCVTLLAARGMPEGAAQALMSDVIPRLKRWRH